MADHRPAAMPIRSMRSKVPSTITIASPVTTNSASHRDGAMAATASWLQQNRGHAGLEPGNEIGKGLACAGRRPPASLAPGRVLAPAGADQGAHVPTVMRAWLDTVTPAG